MILLVTLFVIVYATPRYLLPQVLNTDVPLAVVESGSMEPTIHAGDLLVVVGYNPADIVEKDIIVFRASFLNGSLTVHMVISKGEEEGKIYYWTKGEANVFPDPRIYKGRYSVVETEVHGVVACRIPLVGYLSLLVLRYFGIKFGLLLLPLLILSFKKSLTRRGHF